MKIMRLLEQLASNIHNKTIDFSDFNISTQIIQALQDNEPSVIKEELSAGAKMPDMVRVFQ